MESLGGNIIFLSFLQSRTMQKRRNKISSFLATLKLMLDNQSAQYITWTPQESSFIIKNPSRFSQFILPKYFKHSNLSSFIRQLNIYDFRKVNNEKYPDEYIYEHPWFNKNRPEEMKYIHRKVNSTMCKNGKDSREESGSLSSEDKNHTLGEKKKLVEQIARLEQKYASLENMNQRICQQNLELETHIPNIKRHHLDTSKKFYHFLIQSYGSQYLKFATKVQSQLTEQQNLFNQLCQGQQIISSLKNSVIDQRVAKPFADLKSDKNCYNSTSSGGSNNGQSSRNATRSQARSQARTDDIIKRHKGNCIQQLQKELNSAISKNKKNQQRPYETQECGQNDDYEAENSGSSYNGDQNYPGLIKKIKPNERLENNCHNCSEQQTRGHPNICVIDLNRRSVNQGNNNARLFANVQAIKPRLSHYMNLEKNLQIQCNE